VLERVDRIGRCAATEGQPRFGQPHQGVIELSVRNWRDRRDQVVAEFAANRCPDLGDLHCAEAGDIEKAAALWGKAGQRSAQHSALVESAEQLRRALDLIATLPSTPALRRDEIKLQVELITPLLHFRGYAAPETGAAVERARLLIEQSETLGEPPEDPLLLFSVLYGLWVANLVAFNGDVMRELAVQFLELAKRQSATAPLMVAHRLMGLSLLHTGEIADGRAHLDHAIAFTILLNIVIWRRVSGKTILAWRSLALLLLGYPEAALADTEQALRIGRDSAHSATLTYVLNFSVFQHVYCVDFVTANLPVRRDAAAGNQEMDVRMVRQILSPGVQHAEEANLRAEMPGVCNGDFAAADSRLTV
jgi:hypothetical protein